MELEDQDGARVTFGEFFAGKPSVVAFFYTRCDNPNKCSLTITKLGSSNGGSQSSAWTAGSRLRRSPTTPSSTSRPA